MSLNILLISDAIIKNRTAIHGDIEPKLIYSDIKVSQDMYIEPILGTALFNKLVDDVKNNTLTGDYKILMDKYIVDALIFYTLSELPTTISFQFWNRGVLRKTGQDTEAPSMNELIDLSNKYRQRAEFYADGLRRYLLQHAPTKFPEYINPGSGYDDVQPAGSAFTMPVYLGEDWDCDDDPRSYEERYQGNYPKRR